VNEPEILRLTIDQNETGSGCRIAAAFHDIERDIETEMLPQEFRRNLVALQEAILNSPGARGSGSTAMRAVASNGKKRDGEPGVVLRDVASVLTSRADEKMVQEIGSRLFDFVFQRKVLDLYRDSYKAAKEKDQPLFIKLYVNHHDLSYVPWETLWDKANRIYISTFPYTPFSRGLSPNEDEKPLASGRPIRILGMAARVKTLNGILVDAIDVDGEQGMIKRALEKLETSENVKINWIPSAKARDLNRGLARGDEGNPWDVFHFIGHGGYDPDRGMGFIVVQEEGGSKGTQLYSDSLKDFLIQPRRTPKLVVLNSCSGAQGQPGDLFSSMAADLIEGGIPAIIAMQFEISDQMAIAFSEAFYTYLGDGESIQTALAHTRAELRARNFGEWISPVLYMRSPDGAIFRDVAEPAAAPDAAGLRQ
jgi:hypothetical protein